MSVVRVVTGSLNQATVVSEIGLEAIHDLYRACFREVVAEIVEAEDPFSRGELQAWVDERFYSRLKLDGRVAAWFRASLDEFLGSN